MKAIKIKRQYFLVLNRYECAELTGILDHIFVFHRLLKLKTYQAFKKIYRQAIRVEQGERKSLFITSVHQRWVIQVYQQTEQRRKYARTNRTNNR